MIKFTVTADNNFIRIFRIPQSFPSDYCFQGGHDVTFKLIDWFNPISQRTFWEKKEVVIEGEGLQDKREQISRFIKEKPYFDPNFQYLALTDYGDVFIIQDKSLEDKKKAEQDRVNKMLENLKIIDLWASEIKKNHIKSKNVNGVCQCPICKANLNWVIHSNGHLWARCSTVDCVNFAE